jgi:cytoskeletal protein RodZ
MKVGTYLRNVRESRHLTIEQVSRRTKIHPSLIIELENNELTHWPIHRVYRHGHLRSYAEAVGLDVEAVLQQFDDEVGDPFPAPFQGPPRPVRQARQAPITNRGLLVSSAIVIAGMAAVLLYEPKNNVAATPSAAVQVPPPVETTTAAPAPGAVSTAGAAPVEAPAVSDNDLEGELRIVSTPADAHVTVNGIGRGETPLRVRFLPPGEYTIRIVEPGYRSAQTTVTITRDQLNQTVRLVLREASASTPAVLTASDSAR